MAYYAMYHKSLALFFYIGIKCENHVAVIMLLQELFGIDNEQIAFAKKERVDKQYYTDFVISLADVNDLILLAEEFTAQVGMFISRLSNDDVSRFRDSFFKDYMSQLN